MDTYLPKYPELQRHPDHPSPPSAFPIPLDDSLPDYWV
jgi:hypothetical protein